MTAKHIKKPDWLKVRFPGGPEFARIDRYHRQKGLHSVCRSAACPNQGECWSRGTATFMILGDTCTRGCRFCNVQGGEPLPVDTGELAKVAEAVAELGLKHAVITSVTRDDLPDGGAGHFAALVREIRLAAPKCTIELLIPDLQGDRAALRTVLEAGPDLLGHNMETVPRLYQAVRQGADYARSLQLLDDARTLAPQIPTKSGLMLGLGETREELMQVMNDLLSVGCRLLTIGQYLAPTREHVQVERYVPPQEFEELGRQGQVLGFDHVESGPLVRSSYHADRQFEESGHG